MMRTVCGITGLPCSQCTPCCEHEKSGLVNSLYAAEHERISEVNDIAGVYEEMVDEDNESVMAEADIQRTSVGSIPGEDCTCGKDIVRGSVLEEAVSVINGARQNVYGHPENSFAIIGMFWDIVDMVDPDMRLESLTAVKMALMKIARILSKPKDRDSWRDAAGYIGLGCDIECAQDICKDCESGDVTE